MHSIVRCGFILVFEILNIITIVIKHDIRSIYIYCKMEHANANSRYVYVLIYRIYVLHYESKFENSPCRFRLVYKAF